MTEKINKYRWVILIIFIFLILTILYFLFVLDIGLNGKYFIRRDFNNAFLARQTGNCDAFINYIDEKFQGGWRERCLEEKSRKEDSSRPIITFSIKNITINNNRAFLQVELEREPTLAQKIALEKELSGEIDLKYLVNYELVKNNSKKLFSILPVTNWVISQELK